MWCREPDHGNFQGSNVNGHSDLSSDNWIYLFIFWCSGFLARVPITLCYFQGFSKRMGCSQLLMTSVWMFWISRGQISEFIGPLNMLSHVHFLFWKSNLHSSKGWDFISFRSNPKVFSTWSLEYYLDILLVMTLSSVLGTWRCFKTCTLSGVLGMCFQTIWSKTCQAVNSTSLLCCY